MRRAAAALGLAALLALGCGPEPASLLLRVRLPAGLAVEQLRARVTDLSGKPLFEPLLRPEQPGGSRLSGDQTIRLLLPDELDGETLRVVIEALAGGKVVGRGEGAAVAEMGSEAELLVAVVAVEP
ncbi:MAG: hypothetical protein ACOX6T_01265 [Myxococcales bacterium]|jgi:hypothetical protein